MIRRSKNVPILHSFVQNLLLKCQSYWGALLLRPSPTSGFDPCLCTKSTPPFSGRGAFGWAGRGQECSCPKGRNIGALRSRANPGWAAQSSPGALLFRPSPTSGFDPCPLCKKHPSLFREGCFWLGWQGSNLRCGSQSPMPYRLATAQYKKKRTLFCIKSALSLWGG